MLYIFTSYCLNRSSNWEFQKKMDVFESKPSKWASQMVPNKTWPSPSEACVSCTLPAQRRRIPPCAGSLGPKPSTVWTPRRPPPLAKAANVDSPNGEAPRATIAYGHWNVQVDVFLSSWRWGSIPPFSGFWSYIVASITHPCYQSTNLSITYP